VTDTGAATFVRRDGATCEPRSLSEHSSSFSAETSLDLRALLFRLWTNVAGGLSSFDGPARAARTREAVATACPSMSTAPDARPTYQGFYDLITEYVGDDTLLMSGIGLDRFGALSLPVHTPSGFICQAAYRDAGFVAPAAIGAALGGEHERVMVFVGDGGFQMTAQCLGTMAEEGLDPILFVLNNGVYGAEQRRADAATFEQDEAFFPQTLLQHWHYRRLPDAMGGKGWRVETYGELRSAVEEAAKYTGGPLLIDVRLRQKSLPALATDPLDTPERSFDLAAEAVLPNSS
jgi:indolepyruvate decarboxylase